MAEVETKTAPLQGGAAPVFTSGPRTVSATGASERPWIFVLVWSLSWAMVGLVVGSAIVLARGVLFGGSAQINLFGPTTKLSILFAEVVGLTALSSSRLVFPYYVSLPYIPRLLLQIATVGGGALFGTVSVALMDPLFSIHNAGLVGVVAAVNATLAVIVSIAVHTYESMKRQIERSYEDLLKREAFDREMEFAREVQEQLFPKSVPRLRGLEVAGVCLPAAGVGGDYYDYLPLSEDRLGLVVADVSGKGISAALLMASLQASVRSVIGPDTIPSDVNVRLNEILYRSTTPSRYATLFLGMFDGRDSTFHYSNAGHNPPIVVSDSGTHKLSEGGLPLGVIDGVRYGQGCRVLAPGDLLLMYTDGAIEATDPAGREFGLERLAALLQPRRHDGDLAGLISVIVKEVREWSRESPQQDDITLVLARTMGPS